MDILGELDKLLDPKVVVVDYCFIDDDDEVVTVRDVTLERAALSGQWLLGENKDGRFTAIPVHRILWVMETKASAEARSGRGARSASSVRSSPSVWRRSARAVRRFRTPPPSQRVQRDWSSPSTVAGSRARPVIRRLGT